MSDTLNLQPQFQTEILMNLLSGQKEMSSQLNGLVSQVAVLTEQVSTVREDVGEIKDNLKLHAQTAEKHGEQIHMIQLEMARRQDTCPLVATLEKGRIQQLERSVVALKRGQAVIRGGYAAVAGIAGGVTVLLTAVYHVFNIGKLVAPLIPRGQ